MEETTKVHQDIAARVAKVAGELGQDFMIISRGDSTLRGHYPLETQLLAEGLADGNTAGPEKTAAEKLRELVRIKNMDSFSSKPLRMDSSSQSV